MPDDASEVIWSRAELAGFLHHEHPLVRLWAVDRLFDLGFEPDDEALLLPLLEDEQAVTTSRALNALTRVVSPAAEERLRTFLRREDVPGDQLLSARGLLAGLGDRAAQERLLADAEAGNDWALYAWYHTDVDDFVRTVHKRYARAELPASVVLLRFLVSTARPELAGHVLRAVSRLAKDTHVEEVLDNAVKAAGAVGLWLPEETDDEMKPPEPPEPADEQLAGIHSRTEDVTQKAVKLADREDWESLTRESLDAAEEIALRMEEAGWQTPETSWGLALAREWKEIGWHLHLDDPLTCAAAACGLVTGLHDTFMVECYLRQEDGLAPALDAFEWASSSTIDRVREQLQSRWEAAQTEAAARQRAEQTLREWLDVDDHRQVLDRLICTRGLDLPGTGETLLQLAERTRRGELSWEWPGELWELLAGHLAHSPEQLRQSGRRWLEADPIAAAEFAGALEMQNESWATRMVLDSLDFLAAHPDGGNPWELLRVLGDPAALPAAVEAWRPREHDVARCAGLLARLDGSFDQLPDALRAEALDLEQHDLARQTSISGGFEDFDLSVFRDEPIRLKARCLECDRVYTYEFERVFVDPDAWSGNAGDTDVFGTMVPGGIVECKNCGARDRYELLSGQHLNLMPALFASMEGEDVSERRIVPGVPRLSDGTVVRIPTEAIEHLRREAEAHPDRGETWRRLGNLCGRFGQTEEAVAAWKRAMEVDETEVQAAVNLADEFWGSAKPDHSPLRYILEAIRRLPDAPMEPAERWDMADLLVEMLKETVPYAYPPVCMMAAWPGGRVNATQTVNLSEVDLRHITRWDRLTELLAANAFTAIDFSPELPDESPTQLEILINETDDIPGRPDDVPVSEEPFYEEGPAIRAAAKVGRNDPCPCGSGRKYKHCCGAPGKR
ncbi:MAG: SEC-C metal-binding domain-containing protein [Candidatus Brocadiia bacterium]